MKFWTSWISEILFKLSPGHQRRIKTRPFICRWGIYRYWFLIQGVSTNHGNIKKLRVGLIREVI